MLISYRHKFLFVHLYKTAGNSMVRALEPYSYRPGSWRPSNWLTWLTVRPTLILRERLPKHASAADLRKALPAEIFDGYYKFAFVRNPWDWQVSLYHYILEQPGDTMHGKIVELGSFDAYIRWRASNVRTQTSLLCDESGRLLVDFVGKVESIEQDFRQICSRLNICASLPHVNKSNRSHYRDYYSAETSRLVSDLYAEDIERFGYSY